MTRDLPRIEIGLIGGTGLYDIDGLSDVRDIDIETPYGAPSSTIRTGALHGRRVAFLARHGAGHRLLPTEIPYRANVYALRMLGVQKVLASGAVGSLREDLPPRTLVVPAQFVDRTRARVNTFFGDGFVAHVHFGDPFAPALRRALLDGARETGEPAHDGGTYLCMEGPQFSTRAESIFYKEAGCSVIGMTNLTEARLAREAEIAYASLALVTDYDAWRPHEASVDAVAILTVLRDNAARARQVIAAAIEHVPQGLLPENDVLKASTITPPDQIPAQTRARLAAILAGHA